VKTLQLLSCENDRKRESERERERERERDEGRKTVTEKVSKSRTSGSKKA